MDLTGNACATENAKNKLRHKNFKLDKSEVRQIEGKELDLCKVLKAKYITLCDNYLKARETACMLCMCMCMCCVLFIYMFCNILWNVLQWEHK